MLLDTAVKNRASDLHITVGVEPTMRVNGELRKIGEEPLIAEETRELTRQILTIDQFEEFQQKGDYDLSFSINGVGRFRVNAFKQRGSCSLAIRSVGSVVPTMEQLKLPEVLRNLVDTKRKGLILVTGATGTGKSTSLASMIDHINETRKEHIITLEDPIEYIHDHKKSIVNQRELGLDFNSFAAGLRAALRQDPDVILLGEMRDVDSIQIALTAAETGHLVFSTLHTMDAVTTIDRIIDVFPPHQQQQVRVQMANVLEAVLSQQLIPMVDGNRAVATEFLLANSAIKNLMREKKSHLIQNSIQTGGKYGMHSMNSSIRKLYKDGKITEEIMKRYLIEEDML